MKINISVKAEYYVTSLHPDIQYISNPTEKLEFNDTYVFNVDTWNYWEEKQERLDYIIQDILLVISGGYHFSETYFDSITIYADDKIVYQNYPILQEV